MTETALAFPPADCRDCGRCCFSELPEYVRVFGVDLDRMTDEMQLHTHFIGNRCYMRLEEGHCTALVIDPISRRSICGIYEGRPDVCRSLERGTSSCFGEFSAKADRPDVAIERLLAKLRDEKPA
jgi:uncharacterized protein